MSEVCFLEFIDNLPYLDKLRYDLDRARLDLHFTHYYDFEDDYIVKVLENKVKYLDMKYNKERRTLK